MVINLFHNFPLFFQCLCVYFFFFLLKTLYCRKWKYYSWNCLYSLNKYKDFLIITSKNKKRNLMTEGDLLIEGIAYIPVLWLQRRNQIYVALSQPRSQTPSIYIFIGCMSDAMHPNVCCPISFVCHSVEITSSFPRTNVCFLKINKKVLVTLTSVQVIWIYQHTVHCTW